jgi:hypothetical protein
LRGGGRVTGRPTSILSEILPGTGSERVLTNLIDDQTDDNVYTFIFDGNSQVLDHFLVSDAFLNHAEIDIVHVNVDFPRVDDTAGSDQEPIVGLISFADADDDDDDDDGDDDDDD